MLSPVLVVFLFVFALIAGVGYYVYQVNQQLAKAPQPKKQKLSVKQRREAKEERRYLATQPLE